MNSEAETPVNPQKSLFEHFIPPLDSSSLFWFRKSDPFPLHVKVFPSDFSPDYDRT